MTRQEQNAIIINSISTRLKDLPNVQAIISSKFDAWFRELVVKGTALLQQGQTVAAGAGGEEQASPEGEPNG